MAVKKQDLKFFIGLVVIKQVKHEPKLDKISLSVRMEIKEE